MVGNIRRLLGLAFIWGWSFLFIKVAVAGLTPPTVACLRVALGALVLRGWLRHQGTAMPRDRRTWANFLVVGAIGSAVPFTLLAWGEERTTTALTAVANASTPLFAALFAAVLVRERLKPLQLVGLAVGFVGVGVAAGLGAADLTSSSTAGVLASALAGAAYGLSATWMGKHLTHLPPAVAAAGQLTVAATVLAPFAAVTTAIDGIHLSPTRVLAILVLGLVGTGGAYLLFYRVIAELGGTKASLVTYVIPVIAIAVGVLVLDEAFTVRILAGGLLVAGGIGLVNGVLKLPRRVPQSAATVVLVALAAAATLAGCGDGDGGADPGRGCAAEITERLDPASAQHLLPGAAEPTYLSDPPTSGPHQPAELLDGVQERPLSRSAQVGQLEAGAVLLQHRTDLPADQLDALEALAAPGVVVAPNDDLPAPVVATAWLAKQSCATVDAAAIEAFVAAHAGQGPGRD